MKRLRGWIIWLAIALMFVCAFAACVKDGSDPDGADSLPDGDPAPQPDYLSAQFWMDYGAGDVRAVAGKDIVQSISGRPTRDLFVFGGWYYDKDVWERPVSEDSVLQDSGKVRIYARWIPTEDACRVTFYDYQGAVLADEYVARGADLSGWNLRPSAKPATQQFTYYFGRWDQPLTDIQGNTEFYPIYNSMRRTYTVRYWVEDELIATIDNVEYGGFVLADRIPSVEQAQKYVQDTLLYRKRVTGWDAAPTRVEGDMDIRAVIEQTPHVFTVTFVDETDTPIASQTVHYGESVDPPQMQDKYADGTKYLFVGWAGGNYRYVTQDMTIRAIYDTHTSYYSVEFYHYDWQGQLQLYDVQRLPYDASVTAPTTPVRVADDTYRYEFRGWETESGEALDLAAPVTRDVRYYAVYDKTPRTYRVRFWQGETLLDEQFVARNASATAPAVQLPQQTAQYSYAFIGWDKAYDDVVADINVYAQIERTVRTYRVTFVFGDMEGAPTRESQTVAYGQAATAPDRQRVARDASAEYTYAFIGWDGDYLNIVGETELRAQYDKFERYYEVRFVGESGELLAAPQFVRYGAAANVPDAAQIVKQSTAQYHFSFDGWTDVDGTVVPTQQLSRIERDLTLRVHFASQLRAYTVTFLDDFGNRYGEPQTVYYGSSAQAPEQPTKNSTVKYEYSFDRWSTDAWTDVQGDTVVTAQFISTIRKYLATFFYGDGESETMQVEYESQAVAPSGEILNKVSTAKYHFAFTGWDRSNMTIYGDTEFRAEYKRDIRFYTVTLMDVVTGKQSAQLNMAYGSLVENTLSHDGYTWDAWYDEQDCYTVLPLAEEIEELDEDGFSIGHIQGDRTLYGNCYMTGLQGGDVEVKEGLITRHKGWGITTYNGTANNIIIPKAIGRRHVTALASKMLYGCTAVGSVYVPRTVECVGNRAFAFTDGLSSSDVLVLLEGNVSYTKWHTMWYHGFASSTNDAEHIVTGVERLATDRDFMFVLRNDGTAILHQYLNNSAKHIEMPLTAEYAGQSYQVNRILKYAFSSATNLASAYFPSQTKNWKVGVKIFNGLNLTAYMQMSKSLLNNTPAMDDPFKASDWKTNWSDTDVSDTKISVEWDTVGLTTADQFTFIIRTAGDGYAAIASQYDGAGISTVKIPTTVSLGELTDIPVTELGAGLFKGKTGMLGVQIPDTVTKIGDECFSGCLMLGNVQMPSALKQIGKMAFLMCATMREIYLPASVDSIGIMAFTGCQSLTIYSAKASDPGVFKYVLGWNKTLDTAILTDINWSKMGISDIAKLLNGAKDLPTYWNVEGKTSVVYKGGTANALHVAVTYFLTPDGNAEIVKIEKDGISPILESVEIPQQITVGDKTYTVTKIRSAALEAGLGVTTLRLPAAVALEDGALPENVSVERIA